MSERPALLWCIGITLGLVSAPAVFADIIIMAEESCRTDVREPDTNNHNSSKLSVRSDEKSAKSWIKFDISELDVEDLDMATLTVALHEPKSGNRHFDVSYVNDDCLDNIDWDERSLTWNNAPGNNTADLGALDTSKTTLLTTVNFTDGVPGDSFTIDVLEALRTDTDGIVQFVCHNSNGLLQIATHDHPEEAWRPFLSAREGAKDKAKQPYPADGTTDVSLAPVLNWTPGAYVEGLSPKHKVFFSEEFSDVNDGIGGVTQDAGDYPAPGSPLDFATTYYWRVDEANSVSGWDPGDVWRFTTEPIAYPVPQGLITATASGMDSSDADPTNTIDGSGLGDEDRHSTDPDTMWLSSPSEPNQAWIEYEFDKAYKLHQMLVWNYNGTSFLSWSGIREAVVEYSVDGEVWTPLADVSEFAQAPGTDDYGPGIVIDLDGLVAKHVRITARSNWSPGGVLDQYGLSEVRFLYIPVRARELSPADGSTNVDPTVELSWRAGRQAGVHDVYLGGDPDNLPRADTVGGSPYGAYDTSALDLQLGQTYYWQVNEVNEAEVPATWEGDIVAFSTREFLVVDDFESYSNDPATFGRVFQTWIDGAGYTIPVEVAGNGTGSYIGHDPQFGDIMEKVIVHGGAQSAPIYYGNDGKTVSEVDRTFDEPQDWTRAGIKTLAIAFHGASGNTGQLYVKINNTRVGYDLDAADIAIAAWQAWNIDLSTVPANLQNVTKLTIGVDGGGAGIFYVDDIRLYAKAGESITPAAPDTAKRIFIDGYLETSNTVDADYDLSGTSQHNAYIGAITDNSSGSLYKLFKGLIDEVRVYSRALSAEEILWLAGRTTPVHKPL